MDAHIIKNTDTIPKVLCARGTRYTIGWMFDKFYQTVLKLWVKPDYFYHPSYIIKSNAFTLQEPLENPRIKEKIQAQYGDGLELFSKINVNGGHAIPLFDWLKSKQSGTLWK